MTPSFDTIQIIPTHMIPSLSETSHPEHVSKIRCTGQSTGRYQRITLQLTQQCRDAFDICCMEQNRREDSAHVGIRTRVSASKGPNDWPLHYQSAIGAITHLFIRIIEGPVTSATRKRSKYSGLRPRLRIFRLRSVGTCGKSPVSYTSGRDK